MTTAIRSSGGRSDRSGPSAGWCRWAGGAATAALVLGLSACASTHHAAGAASATTAPSSSSSTAPGGPTTTPTSTGGPSTAPTSGAPTPTAPAGPGRCTAGHLTGQLTGANGTAGSIYYSLVLTNTGSVTCILQGYPGVSFVTGSHGQQLGAPADRNSGLAPDVTLAPGQSGKAVLQITDATNFGSGCGVTATDGLRVYPPDQLTSLFIAHTDRGCADTTDVTLHVGAFQPSM
ncbi:MAG TPA: DUF4232 domain-containing protein [Acidimicrobiales bacterium]|nr:DUF4232 domain-containing protein [Acidimicrobiales bacterium]